MGDNKTKWIYEMNVLRLDEVGRRLRDIYMTKFQYGFPFLTKLEVEESHNGSFPFTDWF